MLPRKLNLLFLRTSQKHSQDSPFISLLSIVPGFGPILPVGLPMRGMLSGLDGFVFVAVGGLVAFKLLPHSIDEAGWGAGVAAIFGFGILNVVERLAAHKGAGSAAKRVRAFALLVAATGVALHELLDGVALATSTVGEHAEHVLPASSSGPYPDRA